MSVYVHVCVCMHPPTHALTYTHAHTQEPSEAEKKILSQIEQYFLREREVVRLQGVKVCVCVCVCVCLYACMPTCVRVRKSTTHLPTHTTNTHTHIHTQVQRIDKSDNRKELVGQASAVASQDIEPYTLIGPYAGMYVHIVDGKDIQSRSERYRALSAQRPPYWCVYIHTCIHTHKHTTGMLQFQRKMLQTVFSPLQKKIQDDYSFDMLTCYEVHIRAYLHIHECVCICVCVCVCARARTRSACTLSK